MTATATAEPRPLLGLFSVRNLLIAQVIGLVAGSIAAIYHRNTTIVVGIGVSAAALLLIPIGKRVVLDWLGTWFGYLTERDYPAGKAVDFRGPDGRSVGLHWNGHQVVAVVEMLAPADGLTRIDKETVHASHLLPLPELARTLVQHDIVLSGIDIISHGHRSRTESAAGTVYGSLLGPLPATAQRTVWLAVGLDTSACPDAIARRGGGSQGAARAITLATRRVIRAVEDAGCPARVLTAQEISAAITQITAGYDAQTLTHSWSHVELGSKVNVGSAVDPKRLGSDVLAQLWVPASFGTTVTVRLRPGTGRDTVAVGAAWRISAAEPPPRRSGMVSMHGRHRAGLLAHLPIAVPNVDDTVPTAEYPIDRLDRLRLPSSGCGQILGSDSEGHGVAVRVIGAGIARVYVAGELFLAHQLVFRALAIGERILIRTDRPQAWERLVHAVDNPGQLAIAAESHQSDTAFTASVVDGVLAPPPHAGVTTIYLAGDPVGWPTTPPDVSIHQPGAHGRDIIVRTGNAPEVGLTLVSVPQEASFLSAPRRG